MPEPDLPLILQTTLSMEDQVTPVGEVIVYLSAINDKGFYLQLASQESTLQNMSDLLLTLCPTLQPVSLPSLSVGNFCCAKFSEDDAWYRAVVTDIKDQEVTVTFIDYGNGETLPGSSLKQLHKEILSPAMAFRCCLDGCESVNPTNLEPRLTALMDSTELNALFKGKIGDLFKVVLTDSGVNVNQELGDKGDALAGGDMMVLDETGDAQKLSEIKGSSLKISDTKCGPCDVREKNNQSLYWCMSCEEGLCEECYDHHRAIKSSRNHSVVPLESVKHLEQFISSFKTDCSIHDKPLELFCPCHEEPCCTKCASLSHQNCVGITLFQTVVNDLKRSDKLSYLDNDIGTLLKNIDSLIENRKVNLKEISDQGKTKFDLFAVLKEKLKDLEIKLQSKCQGLHVAAYAEIEAVVAKLQKKRQMIIDYKNNLSQLRQIGADTQLFHGTKQMEKFIEEEGKALYAIVKEPSMQEVKIKSKMSDNFKQIVSDLIDVTIKRENSTVILKDVEGS
ncbi:tudor domain-containing protein 1-like [Mytilus californianus]|uniref:tudor domain-containing protein 1-like n=1 Tax=Mytilus californianus TaxID=6549 RepID=UPI0022478ABB|nr:tudor domain-containing protein 1-like [Mytilus californianus]